MASLHNDFKWESDVGVSFNAERARGELAAIFPGMFFDFPPKVDPFIRVEGYGLGPGRLLTTVASVHIDRRVPPDGDHTSATFGLTVPLDGGIEVNERERHYLVDKQSACLIDGAHPFSTTSCGTTAIVILQLPRNILIGRYPHFSRRGTHAFDPEDSGTMLLRDLIQRSVPHISKLDEAQRTALFWAMIDLIGLPKWGVNEVEWRVERAVAYIRAHVGYQDLTAQSVAKDQSISRRSLDELFCRVLGRPVAAVIADQRLILASEALADPRQANRRIGDIAYSVGFEHAAHFTRAFLRKFGATPKSWRNAARDLG